MSSTSQKHRNFVAEPMGNKPVTDLAGIGEVLGGRFEKLGFDKLKLTPSGKTDNFDELQSPGWAYVVLGQFLVLKKNKEFFIDWMKDSIGANQKQATDCYQCLSDWCDEFL